MQLVSWSPVVFHANTLYLYLPFIHVYIHIYFKLPNKLNKKIKKIYKRKFKTRTQHAIV